MFEKNDRKVDVGIYLNENRYHEPKEIFKFISNLIEKRFDFRHKTLLDIGCATGEFVFFLHNRFPHLRFMGIDISPVMITKASQEVPIAHFAVHSILNSEFFEKNKFDLITCNGVLCIFDNLELPLTNILSAVNPGGRVFIHTMVNDDPIDIIMRYRDLNSADREFKPGWNIFSKKTFEQILRNTKLKISWTFHDFRMPFLIPKREDPMRTWTIKTADNPFQLVNGACQLINGSVLEIEVIQ